MMGDPHQFNRDAEQYLGTLEAYWFRDFDVAIAGGTNYLAALGLITCTEFMGGLILGTLGESRPAGAVEQRIFAAWKRMGPHYSQFAVEGSRFSDWIRNGLTHTYFMKVESAVAMHGLDSTPGLLIQDDGRLFFVVTSYARDFRRMFDEYRRELASLDSSDLRASFEKALGSTWHWMALTNGPSGLTAGPPPRSGPTGPTGP